MGKRKMGKDIRVRFAPSPTGKLHIGNTRTAIFNYLFAKQNNGKLILRIEDTDKERSKKVYEDEIISNLKWLGIKWDESVDCGGDFAPYRQSQRLDIYDKYLNILKEKNLIYECFCTEKELESERKKMLKRGIAPVYSGKCQKLSEDEKKILKQKGLKPSIRFKVPRKKTIVLKDLIHGKIEFKSDLIGDFILMRSNNIPSYSFAVVVDDILMEITHIIRGEDHLSNTARQILLYEAFENEIPFFGHHSLLLGKDKKKLSKRDGDISLGYFINEGYIPSALKNYLAWLGNGLNMTGEFCLENDLVKFFDIKSLSKKGVVFDEEKLKWFNSKHISNSNPNEIFNLLKFVDENYFNENKDKLENVLPHILSNVEKLSEIKDMADIFIKKDIEIKSNFLNEMNRDDLEKILNCLKNALENFSNYKNLIQELKEKTNISGKKLFMTIRVSLTGIEKGPELDKIISNINKDILICRINKALELLKYPTNKN